MNLREPAVDPNEPEVNYVVRERYAASQLCARMFCPIGERQAVADSGAAVSPARWLSCGDIDAADAELGYHDDDGHLLSVSAAAEDGCCRASLPISPFPTS